MVAELPDFFLSVMASDGSLPLQVHNGAATPTTTIRKSSSISHQDQDSATSGGLQGLGLSGLEGYEFEGWSFRAVRVQ